MEVGNLAFWQGGCGWGKCMGHGKTRDAYRVEARLSSKLGGAGLSWVMKVGRPRWIDNVYQHPDNEKEARLCLNVFQREENFPGRRAPSASAHRLGEALLEGDVCNVVAMEEGVPLQTRARRLMAVPYTPLTLPTNLRV